MKARFLLFNFLFLIILIVPGEVFACACCAETGYYKIGVSKPMDFQLSELKKLNFADSNIYSDAGFPENIRGIEPVAEQYSVNAKIADDWMFTFTDNNGRTGTLNLKNPKEIVTFAVDTRQREPKKNTGDVTLYKEWRFKYKIDEATGIFEKGAKKAEYFLVLQGTGNVCTTAEDFTAWRLEVTGKDADFAFFGTLNNKEQTAAVSGNSIDKTVDKTELTDDNKY